MLVRFAASLVTFATIFVSAQTVSTNPGASAPAGDPHDLLKIFSGSHRPDFTLPDIAGAKRSLAGYRGRPVLVHFFATWCEPCRPEMAALERFNAQHSNAAMHIVAISVAEPDGRVQRFFEKSPVSFPILLDRDRAIAKSWNVQTLPTSYLLDANLTPRLFVEQDLEWDRLDFPKLLQTLKARATAGTAAPRPQRTKPTQTGG